METVRIASFNLWGRFGSWPDRLQAIATCWWSIEPDIVFLQECRRDGSFDQAEEFAAAFGYPHLAVGDRRSEEVVAIVSREPLSDISVIELPASTPLRCAVAATTERLSLRLVAAHTAFRPAAVCRRQLQALAALEGDRIVIGGDLNAPPSVVSEVMQPAGLADCLAFADEPSWPVSAEQFSRAWHERNRTRPRFSLQPRRLDYLLGRGIATVGAELVDLADGPVHGSDHRLLYADYRL